MMLFLTSLITKVWTMQHKADGLCLLFTCKAIIELEKSSTSGYANLMLQTPSALFQSSTALSIRTFLLLRNITLLLFTYFLVEIPNSCSLPLVESLLCFLLLCFVWLLFVYFVFMVVVVWWWFVVVVGWGLFFGFVCLVPPPPSSRDWTQGLSY